MVTARAISVSSSSRLTKLVTETGSACPAGSRAGGSAGGWSVTSERAGGRFLVCPICFNAKQLDKGDLLPNAELGGTVQLWEWIGEEAATTFSY